jgi:hypothetical protein
MLLFRFPEKHSKNLTPFQGREDVNRRTATACASQGVAVYCG